MAENYYKVRCCVCGKKCTSNFHDTNTEFYCESCYDLNITSRTKGKHSEGYLIRQRQEAAQKQYEQRKQENAKRKREKEAEYRTWYNALSPEEQRCEDERKQKIEEEKNEELAAKLKADREYYAAKREEERFYDEEMKNWIAEEAKKPENIRKNKRKELKFKIIAWIMRFILVGVAIFIFKWLFPGAFNNIVDWITGLFK